jgi:hypothetical protein
MIRLKIFRLAIVVVLAVTLSACGTRTVFSNIKKGVFDEGDYAVIKDDYFHYPWSIVTISMLNNSTGEFEEICDNRKLEGVNTKYVLTPGTYEIYYAHRHYKIPLTSGVGVVELEAGHEYRVNHATCDSLYHIYKEYCRGYTATIWFEDVTTGEVLSGYKWDHLK